MKRFVFFVHPLSNAQLRLFYLRRGRWDRAIFLPLPSIETGGSIFSFKVIHGETTVHGSVHLIPLTPHHILRGVGETHDLMVRYVEDGMKRGFETIGMGGYLSFLWFKMGEEFRFMKRFVTSGIDLTVYTAVENLLKTASLFDVLLENGGEPVGITGFPYPISKIASLLLIKRGVRVILLNVEETRVLERFLKDAEKLGCRRSIEYRRFDESNNFGNEGRFILSPLPYSGRERLPPTLSNGSVVVDLSRRGGMWKKRQGIFVVDGESMKLRSTDGVKLLFGLIGHLYNLLVGQSRKRGYLSCFVEPIIRALKPSIPSNGKEEIEERLERIIDLGQDALAYGFYPHPSIRGMMWWQSEEKLIERFRKEYFLHQF